MTQHLTSLLAHLAMNPALADDLLTLHNLALYDSGEALLGAEEKSSLQSVQQLSALLRLVDPDELRNLL